ncbi:unnamed protein product [Arctia plantaginis]|uniref:Uncharacterized protein n=1 Tax=Arctia plantaginis TaxID=874455 RepID=A0A8S1A6S3_ARCPL|nr:unnamed protein product [Arctia plantaginis]
MKRKLLLQFPFHFSNPMLGEVKSYPGCVEQQHQYDRTRCIAPRGRPQRTPRRDCQYEKKMFTSLTNGATTDSLKEQSLIKQPILIKFVPKSKYLYCCLRLLPSQKGRRRRKATS